MKQIYMDYAAATPLDDGVLAAMQPYLQKSFYNPSATYLAGRAVADALIEAKKDIAGCLGSRASEITFVAGGTEANNLAIRGVMERYPKGHMITSAIEHESVLKPAEHFDYSLVPVKPDGIVDAEKLHALIRENTVLVSIMYANNEIGTIQPIKEISRIVHNIRADRQKRNNQTPLYLHTDACQAANYLDLHVSRLGVDMMTINGGKIYGPKQSGALYIKAGLELEPIIYGGGQQKGLRSGTENVASSIGLAVALNTTQSMHKRETERLQKLQSLFLELVENKLPNVAVNGSKHNRLPNNIHVTFPGSDNERLMMQLDEKGIQCAVGSACSASSEEPSHVLKAIGLSDEDAQASLRFTLGRQTTENDIKAVIKALASRF